MSSFLFYEHIKHFMTQIVETELRCTRLFAVKRIVRKVFCGKLYSICALVCCVIILPRNQKAQIKSLAGRCRNMTLNLSNSCCFAVKGNTADAVRHVPCAGQTCNTGCSSTIFHSIYGKLKLASFGHYYLICIIKACNLNFHGQAAYRAYPALRCEVETIVVELQR